MKHSGKREAVTDFLDTVTDSTYDHITNYLRGVGFEVSNKTQRADLVAMSKAGEIDVIGKRRVGKMMSNVYALPKSRHWITSTPFSSSQRINGGYYAR